MPSGKNWFNYIYINLAFIVFVIGVFYITTVQSIKDNWPLYRCNPMYMPLSDDIGSDFQYCVQNIQTNYMGSLLQPLTFATETISTVLSGFTDDINYIRNMFDNIRNMVTNIIQSIFGVFLNLIIEFQKIIIGIKDLMGKTIGSMVALMYMLDGSIKTMNSMWKGPPGTIVRSLGKCFDPNTNIQLYNGCVVQIKDINLGDILSNGSVVESTMKIDNRNKTEDIFILKEAGVNKTDIYVTGSHLIYDETQDNFIPVKNYHKAVKIDKVIDWFSCLITNDHKISIGTELFWDWEDHFIKY